MDQQILSRPARRRGMSDRQVAALRPQSKRRSVKDPELKGHYIRVSPSGLKIFYAVARDRYGKQVWHPIGASDAMTIEEAREHARAAMKRIKAGLPPIEETPAKPDSYAAVADNWLRRYVLKNKLRTSAEIERVLEVYVLPHWGERPFESIRRSDVASLLDHVEDNHGPRQADVVLGVVRQIANWYATRDDDYVTPIVRGMSRDKAEPRDRTLTDDEIRALWAATESGTFGGLVRTLLLTGQRLAKVQRSMKWDDIDGGVWTIPTAPGEKGNAGQVRLPGLVLDVVHAQPRFASNPHVFAGRGVGPINNFAEAKAKLDATLGFDQPWVLHDLRRTARSLMSRAGVPDEHAERVLGHVIGGVKGVYDRYSYSREKADALERLADLVAAIINPPADNVRQLKRR
jgi:integrase